MSEWIILGWVGLVSVLGLNGTSAGAAAMLHVWGSKTRRGGRMLIASVAAGALPASFIVVVPLAEGGAGQEPLIWLLALGAVLAVGTVLALPGAIVVSRKLEGPGDDYRAFE